MRWMRGHPIGWAFVDGSLRSILPAVPPTLHFALGTPGSGVLTTKIRLHRLYSKGRVLGHKRAKRNSRPNTSLLQIEGVGSKEEAQFYLGKVRHSTVFFDPLCSYLLCYQRVAYVYKAKKERQGSKVRVIWGYVLPAPLHTHNGFLNRTISRVTRPHGNSGVVKGKFRSNLPPHAFGASVRVVRQLILTSP